MQYPCQLGFSNMTADAVPGYMTDEGFRETGQTIVFDESEVPAITPPGDVTTAGVGKLPFGLLALILAALFISNQ